MNQEIYELLRTFHNQLKSYIGKKELRSGQINTLEALHSLLYLVEEKFIDF